MKIPWKKKQTEDDGETAQFPEYDSAAEADYSGEAVEELTGQSGSAAVTSGEVVDMVADFHEPDIEVVQKIEEKAGTIVAQLADWAKVESDRIAAEAKKSIDELHGYIAQRAEIAKAGFTEKIPVEETSDDGQEEDEQVINEQFTGEQESDEQAEAPPDEVEPEEPVGTPSDGQEEEKQPD